MIFLFEINYHQHISDENRNERGDGCARDTEFWPRADSKNQQWSKHDIEQHAQHLESDSRLDDPGGAQCRAQRHERELQ